MFTQMGVLHHLEEVMSLPPLSPSPAGMWIFPLPHPLMHWVETCTYLSKHCFHFYCPFTSRNQQPSLFWHGCLHFFLVFPNSLLCFFVVCVESSRERCGAVCEWHCWPCLNLEGGEASRHTSDSCLWRFALIQIFQSNLCFTAAPQFFLASVF